METRKILEEFLRTIGNSRRLGKVLLSSSKETSGRPQKICLLVDLKEIGRSKLKDIALKTGYSPQNLCMLYNGLEKEGLIARQVDDFDRRNTYYFLTSEGERAVEESEKIVLRLVVKMFSSLSDDDLVSLKNSLETLNNIMEKIV